LAGLSPPVPDVEDSDFDPESDDFVAVVSDFASEPDEPDESDPLDPLDFSDPERLS
jgi:hypothetical protein